MRFAVASLSRSWKPSRGGALFVCVVVAILLMPGWGQSQPQAPVADSPAPIEELISRLENLQAKEEDVPRLLELMQKAQSSGAHGEGWSPAEIERFELRIRPVLMGTCFKCHGGEKTNKGLQVDNRESLLKGGDSGPALKPGDPAQSLLLKALKYEEGGLQMPPTGALSPEVVADFETWIAQGAAWPATSTVDPQVEGARHWAFQPMQKQDPPADPTAWAENPIDRFVAEGLAEKGLSPNPLADKRDLLRRVTFDLIGLPPTAEEIEAFLADESPEAYEKVVERLLASPRYGERWGRHWMDVARYADTAGDSADYPVPELRFYRDYIIDSFNRDKPFDQFVREQLAGDLLAGDATGEAYAEKVVATGFIALSRRFGTVPYQSMHEVIEDTIDTVGRSILGLTLRCARCHDHKFDPITNEDYYALYGFFQSTQYPFAGAELTISQHKPRQHFVPIERPEAIAERMQPFETKVREYQAVLDYIEKESPAVKRIEELEAQIVSLEQVLPSATPEVHAKTLEEMLKGLRKEKDEAEKTKKNELEKKSRELGVFQKAGLPESVTGAYAVRDSQPVDAPLQKRGEPGSQGEAVPRSVPAVLLKGESFTIPPGTSGRLQLAEWLTRSDNPLTARVLVNRIWQHHFGQGIVRSTTNFGLMGDPPSHPELLDWLALSFIEKGWSIKAVHRLILSSKTYRMSSAFDEKKAEADPTNALRWRFDRNRLDAESIRDALLAVSGRLDLTRPGRHPFPPLADWRYTQHDPFRDIYASTHRSVYLMTPRIQRHPFLSLFDGPDTNRTTGERGESNVPLQALYILNDPMVEECVTGFGTRLRGLEGGEEEKLRQSTILAWGRPPSSSELASFKEYLAAYRTEATASGMDEAKAEETAWNSLARVLLSANEFVFID